MSTGETAKKTQRHLARLRWFKRCIVACIILSVALYFSLKTLRPDATRADSAVKVIPPTRSVPDDRNADARAWLRPKKAGASLWLVDQNGRLRARLLTTSNVPLPSLTAASPNRRLPLSRINRRPEIALCDQNGKVIRGGR